VTQVELIPHDRPPAQRPEQIVAEALDAHGPVCRTVCLISGGGDSKTTAHRCIELYDELCFIDTGTALPGVREHVVEFADRIGKPLRIFDSGHAFDELVLGDRRWWAWYADERQRGETPTQFVVRTTPQRVIGDGRGNAPQGFPGPGRGGHRAAYVRLKERALERMVAELKARHAPGDRLARVALLTGARRHESRRRSMTQGIDGWRLRRSQLWVNPLNDWTDDEMAAYQRDHDLRPSDVAALLHRSGECNCGAYMSVGELEDVLHLFGDWHGARIAPLEARAAELGIPRCVWGERTDTGRPGARGYDFDGSYEAQMTLLDPAAAAAEQELCSSCAMTYAKMVADDG
jgi:3'-phosphoadenosine 5'-phosphosulfate sulfotransferase (PAPS reductase)/FAD synthetase